MDMDDGDHLVIGMGYTRSGEVRHLTVVDLRERNPEPGDDETRPAFCGAIVVRLIRNWETGLVVPYADHWQNSGTTVGGDLCSRCERKEGRRT